jgi:hypothetical protein
MGKSAQRRAHRAQMKSLRRAEEDNARERSKEVSGRALRGLGRRALAFQGVETGLADKLSG